ncbi:putative ATP/GTP-binding protein protein [hydrothermal vent metagenome]|uniref:Putative ATP/GTP-binding protein protein n=1 Tax=hydrothermal vent metagenome TaxID=652676 RepID=A0A1W1ELC2_9ZZZZ
MKNFRGSYRNSDDVLFLVKQIEPKLTDIKSKEANIRDGMHYSAMISPEYEPTQEYLDIFYRALELNKTKVAKDILSLANEIKNYDKPILVSLLRAGTPIGVLLKQTLKKIFNIDAPHYSISIIRDIEIDKNALNYIIKTHPNSRVVFVDGWTGKGVIKRELDYFIEKFNIEFNQNISSELFVLSDIAGVADFSGGYDDYLIPSSALNSTVSGLISRSILNDEYIKDGDFHGVKFYKEYLSSDVTNFFIDTIMKEVPAQDIDPIYKKNDNIAQNMRNYIKDIQNRFKISNINYIKPGVAETTRVLLRRDPYVILVQNIDDEATTHILKLADEKSINIIEDKSLPYKSVGIIKE